MCEITCQGVLFDTLVTFRIIEKTYEAGRKSSEAFWNNMPILLDEILPKWNYRVVPQPNPAKILV